MKPTILETVKKIEQITGHEYDYNSDRLDITMLASETVKLCVHLELSLEDCARGFLPRVRIQGSHGAGYSLCQAEAVRRDLQTATALLREIEEFCGGVIWTSEEVDAYHAEVRAAFETGRRP